MPGYKPTALHKLKHKPPDRSQDAPRTWNKYTYGKQIQLFTQQNSAPNLNSADTNNVQLININVLYYDRAVEPTMIPALNKISTCQYAQNQHTLEKCNQVFDYAPTHPNSTI